jgi:hypothetical protein
MDGPSPTRVETTDVTHLVDGLGSWLAAFASYLRRGATVLAVVVAATGLVAVAVSVLAWRDSPPVATVLGLVGAAGVVMPILLRRRLQPLVAAAQDPAGTAEQARSLFSRVSSNSDVGRLLSGAIGSRRADGSLKLGLRSAWSLSRTVARVIDEIGPDPRREPLLVGFSPSALRGTWFRAVLTVWAWAAAATVAAIGIVALLVRAVT